MIVGGDRSRPRIGGWVAALAILAAGAPAPADDPTPTARAAREAPPDDATFRPTVLVRKGAAQGSGTIIASVPGQTLILTVAHAVQDPGDLVVELHRYNLGIEDRPASGGWPRRIPAEVVATDTGADVAVVRIRGMVALPYVAGLVEGDTEPEPGTVVTSLGIDRATRLSSWTARIRGGVDWDLKRQGTRSPFLITDRAPDFGRSGGGLFLGDGALVGVCVGRIDLNDDLALGLFAPAASIHGLLRGHHLETAVAQSSARRRALEGRGAPPPVTATDHRPRGR